MEVYTMNGTVKWFDSKKGYGFINGDDGKEYFVHYSHIYMRDKFKTLDEDDIVRFDVGNDKNGKECAINVNPLITRQWIRRALEKDKLYVRTIKDSYGVRAYTVVDINEVLQTSEQGMSFYELAKYAGFDVEEICASKRE